MENLTQQIKQNKINHIIQWSGVKNKINRAKFASPPLFYETSDDLIPPLALPSSLEVIACSKLGRKADVEVGIK